MLQEGLGQAQAAKLPGLSVRQIKRLCRRVWQLGAPKLISRRRRRPSNRHIGAEQRDRRVALVCETVARHSGIVRCLRPLLCRCTQAAPSSS